MLEIAAVEPLDGRVVRLTLTDGSVVERDLVEVLWGPVFERVAQDDSAFREVHVRHGTIAWSDDADLAPETVIWGGWPPRRANGHQHGWGYPASRIDAGSRRPAPGRSDRGQPAPEGIDGARPEDERHSLDAGLPEKVVTHGSQGDVGRRLAREAEGPGADGWAGDRPGSQLVSHLQHAPVCGPEEIELVLSARAPDGTDGVDDPPRRQRVGAGRHRCPCGGAGGIATAHLARELGACRRSERAVYAAAVGEGAVRGVDDGVRGDPRDVAVHDGEDGSAEGAALSWLVIHRRILDPEVSACCLCQRDGMVVDRRRLRCRCGNADDQSQPAGLTLDLDSPRHAREVDASRRGYELDPYERLIGGNVDDPSSPEGTCRAASAVENEK